MREKIKNYMRAAYSGLYIVSYEEQRVETEVRAACRLMTDAWGFHVWSITQGILRHNDEAQAPESISDCNDPLLVLDEFLKLPERSVLVLRDYHLFIGVGDGVNPMLARKLKDALLVGRGTNRVLVIVGCRLVLPPELEKELTALELSLPTRDELRAVLDQVAKSAGEDLNGNTDALLDAASGLTTKEAEDAFAKSHIESGSLDPVAVNREKAMTIKKGGLLEVVESDVTLDSIGGLDLFKACLHQSRNLFTKQARQYGVATPRPFLIVGQPGTGKSLSAFATGSIFKMPLLRLEAGRLFGSLVGQTEGNWRSAFTMAKAISPCVFYIDELDGLFSGAASSGQADGGTTNRLCKSILQDIQFNGEGILFFFTANDIDNLPDPLIDRCDVWSVDLPTFNERRSIWTIHIKKRKRNPEGYDVAELAAASDGFSGRQIELAWGKAMTVAFNDDMREPTTEDTIGVLREMTPTSITMAGAIERRRQRLAGKAQPASLQDQKVVAQQGRKLA